MLPTFDGAENFVFVSFVGCLFRFGGIALMSVSVMCRLTIFSTLLFDCIDEKLINSVKEKRLSLIHRSITDHRN